MESVTFKFSDDDLDNLFLMIQHFHFDFLFSNALYFFSFYVLVSRKPKI